MTETLMKAEEIVVHDPATGREIERFTGLAMSDVPDIVRRSRLAWRTWAARDAAERSEFLHRAATALQQQERELATLNRSETGKPFDDALAGVRAGIGMLRQYAELGPVHRGRSLRGARTATDYSVAESRGVVLALTPWNDPVAIMAGLLGSALAVGNTVIHKPSERCPQVGRLVGRVLTEILPEDVVITATGGPQVGAYLADQHGIDVIAHVGSTATGRAVMAAALKTGAHTICENGGNDALIVDSGVDVEWAAAQAAQGAYANCGQICTSVERIFVHSDIADEFCDALVAEADRLNASSELGPLVDRKLRDSVDSQVQEALAMGAKARAGATIPSGDGSFYPATVLTACDPSMRIMGEETFGPVAPICVVNDFRTALDYACDDAYGLAATVLTTSMEHAQLAVASLPVGTVKVNAVFGGAPGGSAQPRKDSGHGFGYGPELLNEMTTTKVVHIEAGPRR